MYDVNGNFTLFMHNYTEYKAEVARGAPHPPLKSFELQSLPQQTTVYIVGKGI